MKRTIYLAVAIAIAGLIAVATTHAQDAKQPVTSVADTAKEEEFTTWLRVDKQSISELEKFIAQYTTTGAPGEEDAKDAKIFLSLAKKVADIKSGKVKSGLVLPFDKLPAKWKRWKETHCYGGAVIFNHGVKGDGLAIPRGCSASFDSVGSPELPTKDGSILMFDTEVPNPKWSVVGNLFLNGVIVEAQRTNRIYFAVIDNLGIVHLQGKCTVTLPDKTTNTLE